MQTICMDGNLNYDEDSDKGYNLECRCWIS